MDINCTIYLFIFLALICLSLYNTEHFQSGLNPLWSTTNTHGLAPNCYELNENNCVKTINCGICSKNGQNKCVPGDEHGAFFTSTCDLWKHKEDTVYPWSKFYPEYEMLQPSPVVRSTL